ncbi:MAG: DUF1330 domain-containing protein [Actinomycetes bacterium]
MAKAYVICDIEVTDPQAYEGYKDLAGPAVAHYGGRYLVRGGASEVLEGERTPHRTVVLEFDDLETARRWYHSPEYAAARELRARAATSSLVLVEGA